MTMEEKIEKLVAHVKKEFPHGCEGVECEDCVLHGEYEADDWTIPALVCDLLSERECQWDD